MRAMTLTVLLTTMWLAGCATTPSDSAICAGSADARRALAAALIQDGGAQSQRAGLSLLDKMREGCG